jgi:hypothetical protein
MGEVTFSAQLISDPLRNFRTSSDAPASEILKSILKSLSDNKDSANLKDYVVIIGYPLLESEGKVKEFLPLARPLDGDTTLQDLNLQSGSYVFFIKPTTVSTKLELWVRNRKEQTIEKQKALIGRLDEDDDIYPDFDLTSYLGEFELKVSRKQAYFIEENGSWKIQLADEARSALFVDNQRLVAGSSYDIYNDSVLSFGNNSEKPYLRVIVKIVSN